ncbi:hypothetical protein, partial [Pseudomonas viridiflava]|uniref:hypothetical protein n=1 Tax=Pseudomonas viridiflava TaxID=33069 RepID=UPI0019D1EEFA
IQPSEFIREVAGSTKYIEPDTPLSRMNSLPLDARNTISATPFNNHRNALHNPESPIHKLIAHLFQAISPWLIPST